MCYDFMIRAFYLFDIKYVKWLQLDSNPQPLSS